MDILNEVIITGESEFPIKCKSTNSEIETVWALPHIHKEVELLLLNKGRIEYYINGEKIVLNEGDIMFLNSNIAHSTFAQEGIRTSIIILQFDPSIIYNPNQLSEYKYLMPFLGARFTEYYLFRSNSDSCRELTLLMSKINEEFINKSIAYEISIKSSLYGMLTILYRSNVLDFNIHQSFYKKHETIKRISKILEYIEKNYDKAISVEDACKVLNLNYHYFCRLFKSVTGKTFTEYLNFIRVSAAEKLMFTTEKKFTEIIMETGFSTISYFNRVFKQTKGMSPSNYRKALTKISQV